MEEWKKSMRNAYSRKSEKDVVNEVLKIKAILDDTNGIARHSWALFNKLLPLELMGLSSNVVRATGIGYSVSRFRDHPFKQVNKLVGSILEQWRSDIGPAVDNGVESKKQDQEGGDVELNKKRINPLPLTDRKQILSTTTQQNPVVRILYKKVSLDSDKENVEINSRKTNIPNGPAKVREGEANLKRKPLNMINEKKLDKKSCSGIEDKVEATKRKLYERMGVANQFDRERMVQMNSRKPNIPNGPAKLREGEANLKRKPLNLINDKKFERASCSSTEERVQATKRKLYESYKEAEDAKKKRRIQVIEFHELGKQGLLPKACGQIKKPHSNLIKKLSKRHCRKTICY